MILAGSNVTKLKVAHKASRHLKTVVWWTPRQVRMRAISAGKSLHKVMLFGTILQLYVPLKKHKVSTQGRQYGRGPSINPETWSPTIGRINISAYVPDG